MTNQVSALRTARNMTRSQLAHRSRVSVRRLADIERGANCRMDTQRKLTLALGFTLEARDEVFPRA